MVHAKDSYGKKDGSEFLANSIGYKKTQSTPNWATITRDSFFYIVRESITTYMAVYLISELVRKNKNLPRFAKLEAFDAASMLVSLSG